jgi:AcrR family transcriptional regulator
MARPRQIDRTAVLQASLEIADNDGLEAVTMNSVAQRLGVTPMALYRHVENKRDLLDGVVESLLDEIPTPPAALAPDEQLRAMGDALRKIARRHPAVFPLLLQLPATTTRSRERRDRVQQVLREAGINDPERAERIISTVVLGFAVSEVSGRFASHSRTTLDGDYEMLEVFISAGLAALSANAPQR